MWIRSPMQRLLMAGSAALPPVLALLAASVLFSLFLLVQNISPAEVFVNIYQGAFGSRFSWENTLQRSAPIMLTALCVALTAKLGLIVIGGEGALVLGGLAAAVAGVALQGSLPPLGVQAGLLLAGALAGGIWIAMAGALRHYRGVNETISTLLLTYIGIAVLNHLVEGPLRDPASLNNPSTHSLDAANMLGSIPTTGIHWGLGFAVIACIVAWLVVNRTTFGFAMRMIGGNARAAKLSGIHVGWVLVGACGLGGAAAGLAGAIEVAAVHGAANSSLAVGYGFTGILVAFIARQNALAIIFVAVLLGALEASTGVVQRRMDLPDATLEVFQGIAFLCVLASEAIQGNLRLPHPFRTREATS
ncbi:nucleoside ABC transporter membrane protein [Aquisalimonas asiatica]|uniref:Nucleoside ABC transporter membrane protein n=2 Tax=Aquisalimonas asiatica TaxID=406100 RepID=A0A1H8S3Y6_9GAMM|nr:nucleoside ABC transporter membrane protein [Aquisalimonas asiatica]